MNRPKSDFYFDKVPLHAAGFSTLFCVWFFFTEGSFAVEKHKVYKYLCLTKSEVFLKFCMRVCKCESF